MKIYKAAAIALIVAATCVRADAGTTTVVHRADPTSVLYRWATPAVCVENWVDRFNPATRWAATQLNATILHVDHRLDCTTTNQRIVFVPDPALDQRAFAYTAHRRPGPGGMDLLTSPITIGVDPNMVGDPHVDRIVALHELMHAVVQLRTPEWVDGHVNRCDSVLSTRIPCRLDLDGLTDWDQRQIQIAYRTQP